MLKRKTRLKSFDSCSKGCLFIFLLLLSLSMSVMPTVHAENLDKQVTTYLLIMILGLLVVGPILQRIFYHNLDLAEPSIWFALYYFTHFGLRAIYDIKCGSPVLDLGPEKRDLEILNVSLCASIAGLSAFWIGYQFHFGRVISNSLPCLPRSWNKFLSLPLAFLFIAVGWTIRVFLSFYQSGGIMAWLEANKYIELTHAQGNAYLNILSSFAGIGLIIVYIVYRMRKNQSYLLLFGLLLMPELTFRFVSGSRAQFIFFVLQLMIAHYMTSKRGHKISMSYVKWAGSLLVLAIVLFPLFSVIRGGLGDPVGMLQRSLKLWENPLTIFSNIESRQVGLDSMALLIEQVPDNEPYTLGSKLILPTVAWIPRRLWPDKPEISIGKIFYEKFYPSIYHEGTSVAVTLPGEFYWSFGEYGILLGMTFIGVLWRFLFEYLIRVKGNLSNTLIVSSIFPLFFIVVEQTLVSLLTIHLFQFIMLFIAAYLLQGKGIKSQYEQTDSLPVTYISRTV